MDWIKTTKIKASENVWFDQLSKKISTLEEPRVTHMEQDAIYLSGSQFLEPIDITILSLQYPDQIFEVCFSIDNPYEYRVATYKFLSGKSNFISERYEYCPVILVSDKGDLDPQLYERFLEKVTGYFARIDNYRVRTSESDPPFSEIPAETHQYKSKLTPSVTFREGDVILTATKQDLTYLDIKVEFMEKSPPPNLEDAFPWIGIDITKEGPVGLESLPYQSAVDDREMKRPEKSESNAYL